jgi:hypothetical protein
MQDIQTTSPEPSFHIFARLHPLKSSIPDVNKDQVERVSPSAALSAATF